jgi:hypothetical protein
MYKPLFFASATALLTFRAVCQQPAVPLWPTLASDTVTLQASSQSSAACPSRNPGQILFDRSVDKSGGTFTPFVLPADKVLVITSFDWQAFGSPQFANRSRTGMLFRDKQGVNGPSAQSSALSDNTGRAGGTEIFPSGLVLKNPGKLCLQVDPIANGEVMIGVVNGYLAPDR